MTTTEDDRSGAQQSGGAQLAKLIADAFARATQHDTPEHPTPASEDVGPDH